MSSITLAQAAQWCGGKVEPKYAGVTFTGANNDSRKLVPGQLFLALEGVRDGHDFIPAAFQKGAAAVLCRHMELDRPAIIVDDVRLALGQIASHARLALDAQVVAVTGSVGKSTTKEMIACVLEGSYLTSKTPANHNNDIGMPMSILAMPEDAEAVVLEMGMNHFGEISYLTGIGKPDIGVIVNIGTMHIEHLGSKEGILKAKMEIIDGMSAEGVLLVNGDDPYLRRAPEMSDVPVSFFGTAPDCDVRATDIREGDGHITFTVNAGGELCEIYLPLTGLHYVSDALAAISAGMAMGVALEEIAERLAGFTTMAGRQEIFDVAGYRIIKDCYNAGPESMAAALAVLGKQEGRKIAVLGDMLELGTCADAEHYRVGRIAAENADIVLSYGKYAPRVAAGAVTGGVDPDKILTFTDREAMTARLKATAAPGDALLFKGSRMMKMELVLEGFLKETSGN